MALVCKNNLQWTGLLVTRLPVYSSEPMIKRLKEPQWNS